MILVLAVDLVVFAVMSQGLVASRALWWPVVSCGGLWCVVVSCGPPPSFVLQRGIQNRMPLST
eukprot:7264678-Pyramimonas_sp.AAC.1